MNLIQDIINDNSNRRKHFLGGILCGLCLTIIFAIGAACGMEFKDRQNGGKWDWYDWSATCLGGAIGNIIQALLLWMIW